MNFLRLFLLAVLFPIVAHAATDPAQILGTWLGDKYITFYEDGSYGLQKYEGAPIDRKDRTYSIKGDKITWNALGETFTETIVTLTADKLAIRTAEGNVENYKRVGSSPAAELSPAKSAPAGETLSIPEENPAATLTVPKGWKTEDIERGVSLSSPDDEATILFEVVPKGKVDDLIDENIDWLVDDQKVVIDNSTKKIATSTIGANEWRSIAWKVNHADWGKGLVIIATTPIEAGRTLMLTYWVTNKGVKQYDPEINALFASVKGTSARLPSAEVYDAAEAPAADYPKTPDAVVKAFLTVDAAGKRLEDDTNDELLAYTDWQDVPGWEGIGVIRSFTVGKPVIKGGKATVPVTYQRVGSVEAFTFAEDIAPEKATFDLVQVDGQWKVTQPNGAAPHLDIAATLAYLKKYGASDTPEGKAAIRALTALSSDKSTSTAPEKSAPTPDAASSDLTDPDDIVATFVGNDAAGKALSSDTASEVLGLTTWEDAPGWDTFTVILTYDIGKPTVKGDKATIPVSYDVLGQLSGGVLTKKLASEEAIFQLTKTGGQWKITAPQNQPHILVQTAHDLLARMEKDGTGSAESQSALRTLSAYAK